jgi:hypothetical protein
MAGSTNVKYARIGCSLIFSVMCLPFPVSVPGDINPLTLHTPSRQRLRP